MLSSIVRFSIRFRGIVISLACLLAGYGVYTLYRSTLDVFPEFAPPLAIIQTEASGLSTEQVEVLVTQPIENAVGGTPGLETLRSKSLQGLSMVTMTFASSVDVYRARHGADLFGDPRGRIEVARVASDDLNIDRRGQTKVQNLADNVRRLKIKG